MTAAKLDYAVATRKPMMRRASRLLRRLVLTASLFLVWYVAVYALLFTTRIESITPIFGNPGFRYSRSDVVDRMAYTLFQPIYERHARFGGIGWERHVRDVEDASDCFLLPVANSADDESLVCLTRE
jgi:hypothetical protein